MRLAILCSGQAGQGPGLLDPVLAAPELADLRALAGEVLGEELAAWWGALRGDEIYLNRNAQFAIAVHQLATWARLAPLLPAPSLVAGYSLGEMLAQHVAGGLDARETLRLVRERARLMDEATAGMPPGSAMALWRGRSAPASLELRNARMAELELDLAIVRRAGEEVIAGPADALDRLLADPALAHPGVLRLPVSIPSHSRYLAGAAERFRATLEASRLAAPRLPLLAGVDGSRVRERSEAVQALARQICQTLRWDLCMEQIAEAGVTHAVELGPGSDLARLLAWEHPPLQARSVQEFADPQALLAWLR